MAPSTLPWAMTCAIMSLVPRLPYSSSATARAREPSQYARPPGRGFQYLYREAAGAKRFRDESSDLLFSRRAGHERGVDRIDSHEASQSLQCVLAVNPHGTYTPNFTARPAGMVTVCGRPLRSEERKSVVEGKEEGLGGHG